MIESENLFDRSPVHPDPDDPDLWVYRASSLGNCLTSLVYARLGVDGAPPPDLMLERYGEGHDFEARILDQIQMKGWKLLDSEELAELGAVVVTDPSTGNDQLEVEVKVPGGRVVRCHPDGIARRIIEPDAGRLVVVEAKFLGDSMVKQVKGGSNLPPYYEWQVAVEVAGTKQLTGYDDCLFVIGSKIVSEGENGERVVELGGVTAELITPAHTRGAIIKRVLHVEKLVEADEVPYCDVNMYPCAYWEHHDPDDPMWAETVVVIEPGDSTHDEVKKLGQDYAEAHNKEREWKDVKKEIGKKLRELFDGLKAKGGKVQVDDLMISDVVQKRGVGDVDWQALVEGEFEVEEDVKKKYLKDPYEVRYPQVKIVKTKGKADER